MAKRVRFWGRSDRPFAETTVHGSSNELLEVMELASELNLPEHASTSAVPCFELLGAC